MCACSLEKNKEPNLAALVAVLLLAVGCGAGNPTAPTPTPPTPTPPPPPAAQATALSIKEPEGFSDNRELTVGDAAQFRADLELSDGSAREGVSAEWLSSNLTVATVSESGLVTARQSGGFDVTASAEGFTARLTGLRAVALIPAVDPRFDDHFWRQFVFNHLEDPYPLGNRSWVLEAPLNVYIRLGDPAGLLVVSEDQRDHIVRAVPQLAQQLTGSRYRGRIESGLEDRNRTGWITVRFVTDQEEPGLACGKASVGGNPGNIWITRRERTPDGAVCLGYYFPRIFAHEFGHAMGFRHVADHGAVMISRDIQRATFARTEQYHARLAYKVGRGATYCGWPFQRSCATPKRFQMRRVAPIVID